MAFTSVLIANRGEIAIRIARALAGLGLRSVAVYSEDDARSLHVRAADEAVVLPGSGARAYLDGERIIALARAAGCQAIHPGYGFLSERADFARLCAAAELTFIGPRPEALACSATRPSPRPGRRLGVPISRWRPQEASLDEARDFFEALGPGGAMMIKASAGGGGRGMRLVRDGGRARQAFARCQSEALAAFGDGDVYVERVIEPARHIEVQVLGDRAGGLVHLWERDCSLQRRHQKLIEIAPSPNLPTAMRAAPDRGVADAGPRRPNYDSLGTFEFLVRRAAGRRPVRVHGGQSRLQVEHTVTEEVTGVDLVRAQIEVPRGSNT